jgi:hypothetical protein
MSIYLPPWKNLETKSNVVVVFRILAAKEAYGIEGFSDPPLFLPLFQQHVLCSKYAKTTFAVVFIVQHTMLSLAIGGGSSRLMGSSGRVGGDPEERLPVLGARLCMDIIEREHQETFLESLINLCQVTLIKKKRKFSSYIWKFRMEQLQSHI